MNKIEFKKILFIILLLIFFTHLSFRIYTYRDRYLTKFDPIYWKERYLKSQWIVPNSDNPIGDDGLFAYTSWELINGADPTLINPETQYLNKYILGLTILLFGNENVFALITGVCVLISYYIFNLQVFKNKLFAFLPVLLFSFDPLFYTQLRAPFFDLSQLFFLLSVFIFATKRKYILSSITLGCFAASKFAFLAVLPVIAILLAITLFYKAKEEVYKYLISLPLGFLAFILTYLRFFSLGHNFIDFLKVQKYIVSFYSVGAKTPFLGTVFPLIFLGKWYTHFSKVQAVSEWNILWPLSSIISAFIGIRKNKFQFPVILIISWCIVYMIFLSLTPVFPRYLLLLLPFLYNLAVWFIYKNMPGRSFLRH